MTEFASVQFHHLAEYHTSVWTSWTFDQMTGIGPRFFKNANQLLGETINPDLSVCQETRGWEKARPELISFSTTIFCQPVKASHFRHSRTLFINITPLLSVCAGEDTTFHFKSKYFNQKKKKNKLLSDGWATVTRSWHFKREWARYQLQQRVSVEILWDVKCGLY